MRNSIQDLIEMAKAPEHYADAWFRKKAIAAEAELQAVRGQGAEPANPDAVMTVLDPPEPIRHGEASAASPPTAIEFVTHILRDVYKQDSSEQEIREVAKKVEAAISFGARPDPAASPPAASEPESERRQRLIKALRAWQESLNLSTDRFDLVTDVIAELYYAAPSPAGGTLAEALRRIREWVCEDRRHPQMLWMIKELCDEALAASQPPPPAEGEAKLVERENGYDDDLLTFRCSACSCLFRLWVRGSGLMSEQSKCKCGIAWMLAEHRAIHQLSPASPPAEACVDENRWAKGPVRCPVTSPPSESKP